MDEEKRKRLESLQNEVADLHPLLKILLPKIPNVKNVEYTHGPNEMGADFLLSRLDETFGQLDYVGIVAKVGKIDQAGVNDVDRQIDECFIPKFFDSGNDVLVWKSTHFQRIE